MILGRHLDIRKDIVDVEKDKFTYRISQDVQPILEACARSREILGIGDTKSAFRPYAEIPMTLIRQWQSEGFDYLDPQLDPYEKKKMLRIKMKEYGKFRLTEKD